MGTPANDDERGCLQAFAATLILELSKISEPHTEHTLNRIRSDLHEFLKESSKTQSNTSTSRHSIFGVEQTDGNTVSRVVTRGNGRKRRASTTALLSGIDGQITPISTIKQLIEKNCGISNPTGGKTTVLPREEHQPNGGQISASTVTIATDARAQKPSDLFFVRTAAEVERVQEAKSGGNGDIPQEAGTSSGVAAEAASASHAKYDDRAGESTISPSSHGAVVAAFAATHPSSNDLPSGQKKQQVQQLQPPPSQGHHQQPPQEHQLQKPLNNLIEDVPSSPGRRPRHRVRKVRSKASRRGGEGKKLTRPTTSTLAEDELSNTLGMFLSEQRTANGGMRLCPTMSLPSKLSSATTTLPKPSSPEGSHPPSVHSRGDASGGRGLVHTMSLPSSHRASRSIIYDAATATEDEVEAAVASTIGQKSKRHPQGGSLLFGSATKKRGSARGRSGGSLIFGRSTSSVVADPRSQSNRGGGVISLFTPSFLTKTAKTSDAPPPPLLLPVIDSSVSASSSPCEPPTGTIASRVEVRVKEEGIDQGRRRIPTFGRKTTATTADGTTTAAPSASASIAVGGEEGSDSESAGRGQRSTNTVGNVQSRWRSRGALLPAADAASGRNTSSSSKIRGGGDTTDDQELATKDKVAAVTTSTDPVAGAGAPKRYVWELPVILREQQNAIPGGGDSSSGSVGEGLSLQTDVLVTITNDGRHMLHPQGLFSMTWDLILILLVIYTLATQPLRVGFHNDAFITDNQLFWLLMESGIDMWFLFDVGLNFRTGYWDEQTKLLIMNPQEVKRNYLRGGFCLDLLSSMPFALFLPDDVQGMGFGALRQEVKLFKLLRLARVLRTKTLEQLMTQFHIQPSAMRMFKFIVMFIMVLHVTACSYWYTSIDEGMGSTVWVPSEEQSESPFSDKYAVAFHWAVCAINGNFLSPVTVAEHRFTSFVLFIGIVVSASIIGSASTLLANLNAAAVERRKRLDRINAFLQYRKVSLSLQNKIKDFYEYLWQAGRGSQDEDLFVELPPKLRLQLGLALKEHFIESVPLFKKSSPEFVVALVQRLEPKLATPNEIVIEENTKGNCMFFVNRGSLVVYMGQGEGRVELSSLPMGSFFGEIALLDRYRTRSASVKATTFCDMQSLGKEDFDDFLGAFPFFRKSIVNAAESRFRMSENIAKMQKGHGGGKLMGRRQAATHNNGGSSGGGEPLAGAKSPLKLNRAVTKVQGLLRVQQTVSRSTMFEQAAHLVEAAEKEYRIQSELSDDEEESDWWDAGENEEEPSTSLLTAAVEDGGAPTAPQDGPSIDLVTSRPRSSILAFRGVPTTEGGGGGG